MSRNIYHLTALLRQGSMRAAQAYCQMLDTVADDVRGHTGGLWLYMRAGPTPDYFGVWLPGLLMTGTAVGMVLPSLGGAAVARLAPARFGVGSAVNHAVRQMGSVIGVAATVAFVGHASPRIEDFRSLYLAHIALALFITILCLRIDTAPSRR